MRRLWGSEQGPALEPNDELAVERRLTREPCRGRGDVRERGAQVNATAGLEPDVAGEVVPEVVEVEVAVPRLRSAEW